MSGNEAGAQRSRTAWLQQRRELAGSAVAKNWEAFKSRNPQTVLQARALGRFGKKRRHHLCRLTCAQELQHCQIFVAADVSGSCKCSVSSQSLRVFVL